MNPGPVKQIMQVSGTNNMTGTDLYTLKIIK